MQFLPNDGLGRRAKHRSHTLKPRFYEFNPPRGCNKISVDRLGVSSDAKIAEIAIKPFTRPDSGSPDIRFWGWHVLTVKDVRQVGCCVECDPEPENPYHAHIVFPKDKAVQYIHPYRLFARELASRSRFKNGVTGNRSKLGVRDIIETPVNFCSQFFATRMIVGFGTSRWKLYSLMICANRHGDHFDSISGEFSSIPISQRPSLHVLLP